MEKEYNKEVSSVKMYEIYKTSTGLYIKEEICNQFGIGNRNDIKIIKDNQCLNVNEDDIALIAKESNNTLIPIYITIFDLQLVMSFNVFVDINHNNDLYVSENLCKKNSIAYNDQRVIDNIVYCKVTEEDIEKIENNTKNDKIKLQRKLIEKEIETETNSDGYLFMYYYDIDTNKSYITREVLELCKRLDISIEGTPRIINERNCYSITENELREFENITTYRGVEELVREGKTITEEQPKTVTEEQPESVFEEHTEHISEEVQEPIVEEEQYPITDETQETNDYNEENHNELENTVENIVNDLENEEINSYPDSIEDSFYNPNNNSDLNNTIQDIVNDLDNSFLNQQSIEVQEENIPNVLDEIVENHPEQIVEKPIIETVIAYRDRRTNKLYIPSEYATNIDRPTKTIMRTFCYETTMYDLERIYNKRIIIVDVFPTKKQVYKVIVCNNNGKFFVPEYTLRDLDINVVLDHKIMVNKEIYVEITRSDLDVIKGKETKDLEINIELKHITPTKKRN